MLIPMVILCLAIVRLWSALLKVQGERVSGLKDNFETMAATKTIIEQLTELEKARSRENREFFERSTTNLSQLVRGVDELNNTYLREARSYREQVNNQVVDAVRTLRDISTQLDKMVRETGSQFDTANRDSHANYMNLQTSIQSILTSVQGIQRNNGGDDEFDPPRRRRRQQPGE